MLVWSVLIGTLPRIGQPVRLDLVGLSLDEVGGPLQVRDGQVELRGT